MEQSTTLGELAERFGLELRGRAELPIRGVCTLSPGVAGHIGFLANPRYRSALADTAATAVILSPADAGLWDRPALIAADPYLAFARIGRAFAPPEPGPSGVHASAVIDPGARVDPSARIGPGAVVAAGASVGARTVVDARAVIGEGACVGADCRLQAGAVIEHGCVIGDRVRVGPGAVIGSRGFGLAMGPQGWEDVPQMGRVCIGDDVEIGANTTIDRGALEDTRIGNGVKIDNLVQIAHNVVIGEHTAIAGCAGIAGSATIGARCLIGGGACIAGHLSLADGVIVLGMSMVSRSLDKPGAYGSGMPVDEAGTYRRNTARIRRLGKLEQRVRALERNKDRGGQDD